MSDESKSPWNSLEIAKLFVGLLMPLALAFIGYLINTGFRDADDARADALRQAERAQKELEVARQQAQTRQTAVGNFSHFIYERRARSDYYASFLFIIGGEVAQVYELRRVRKKQREAFED